MRPWKKTLRTYDDKLEVILRHYGFFLYPGHPSMHLCWERPISVADFLDTETTYPTTGQKIYIYVYIYVFLFIYLFKFF